MHACFKIGKFGLFLCTATLKRNIWKKRFFRRNRGFWEALFLLLRIQPFLNILIIQPFYDGFGCYVGHTYEVFHKIWQMVGWEKRIEKI